jgi:hypothetical protein
MKGKQLAILLLLAAVAGATLYAIVEHNRQLWSRSAGGGGKVLDFPVNDVTSLKIKSSAGEVNFQKKGGIWVVRERADYPASFDEVKDLLRQLWALKVGQEVKVGPSQMVRLELVEPGTGDKAGTLVEVGNADGKTLAALLIGKKYGSKSSAGGPADLMEASKGRYVKPLNGTRVFLVTDSLDDALPIAGRWLQKDFVQVAAPQKIAVTGPTDAASWTVTRDDPNTAWKLADARPGEVAEESKTFRLRKVFSAPTFFDVLAPDAPPAETGLDRPTLVRIDTFDGFHYELKIGRLIDETYPTRVSVTAELPKQRIPGRDEKPEEKMKLDADFQAQQKQLAEKLEKEQAFAGRAYLVPRVHLEQLVRERSTLLADKPATPPPPPAAANPVRSAPSALFDPASPSTSVATSPLSAPAAPEPPAKSDGSAPAPAPSPSPN